MLMQNWFRMAAIDVIARTLLALMIDSVIRHVEASSRAATDALAKLRVAYERLGLLHGRLEAAKEDERRFLAHELHDELGQTLTALKLRMQLGARAARRCRSRRDQRGDRAGRRSDRARAQDVGRSAAAAAGRGRPGPGAARLPRESQSALSGVVDGAGGGHREDAAAPRRAAAARPGDRLLPRRRRNRSPTRSATRPPGASTSSSCERPAVITLSIQDDGRGFDVGRTLDDGRRRGPPGRRRHARARARARRHVPGHLAPGRGDDRDGRSSVQDETGPEGVGRRGAVTGAAD